MTRSMQRDRPNSGRAETTPVMLAANLAYGVGGDGERLRVPAYPLRLTGDDRFVRHVVWRDTLMGTLRDLSDPSNFARFRRDDDEAAVRAGLNSLGIADNDILKLTLTVGRWVIETRPGVPLLIPVHSIGHPFVTSAPGLLEPIDIASAIEAYDDRGRSTLPAGSIVEAARLPGYGWSVVAVNVSERATLGTVHEIRLHGAPTSGTIDITWELPNSAGEPISDTVTWDITTPLENALAQHAVGPDIDAMTSPVAGALRVDASRSFAGVTLSLPLLDYTGLPADASATAHYVW